MPTDRDTPPADPLKPDAFGLIRLEALCPLLGMSFEVVRRKYALGELPIRAFRLNNTRKGPLFVHVDDLNAYIARRRKRAAPANTRGELPNAD